MERPGGAFLTLRTHTQAGRNIGQYQLSVVPTVLLLSHGAAADLRGHGVLVEGEEAVHKDGHSDH